jgi:hypothetical protein
MRQLTGLDAQFLATENDRVQGHVSVLGNECRQGPSPRAAGVVAAGRQPLHSACVVRAVMISNAPGPSTPLYLGGARQRAQFPVSGVLDGIGINITVMSYQDSLEFGIVVDRELVDNPWPILDALRSGLDELHDAAQAAAKPVTPIRRKSRRQRKATS